MSIWIEKTYTLKFMFQTTKQNHMKTPSSGVVNREYELGSVESRVQESYLAPSGEKRNAQNIGWCPATTPSTIDIS